MPATCFGRIVAVDQVDSGTRSVHKTVECSRSCEQIRTRYDLDTAYCTPEQAEVLRWFARVDVVLVHLDRPPVWQVVRCWSQALRKRSCRKSTVPVAEFRRCDCVVVGVRWVLKSRSQYATWWCLAVVLCLTGTWNKRGKKRPLTAPCTPTGGTRF